MQLSWQHFVGGIGMVFAAMVAWFSAVWLNLQGANLWVFRLCAFIILALIVGAVVWKLRSKPSSAPAADAASAPPAPGMGAAEDILAILREAESRVASASQLPRGTKLSGLPVIFLVGDSAAGKTCVASQSGLEPELLSGQVYQEGSVAPTRLANVWFARKTLLVEMGGKTLADANVWARLLHRLAPGRLRSIFSGKAAAPRVAVVCYDSEKLAKAAGPEEINAQSRAIRARLDQISQTLGVSFPVYVLFTHADRLPYFANFFRNLSDAEITQVLGVTLPPLPASATGVYAEQETKRLTSAFNSMFHSLADCRPGLLYRERNPERAPDIYEFPREFQKRIAIAAQFLVDLCRPSHLRATPFLRGFYFTGTRLAEAAAPVVGEMIASRTSIAAARPFSPNATSIMRTEDLGKTSAQGWQTATQSALPGESSKTTQWLFVSHIFSHLILQDHAALGASGSSTKTNVWKRALLATAGVFALIWSLGMIVSFFANRALERDVRKAAEGIAPIRTAGPALATLGDLQRLEAARVQLQKIATFQRTGAPLHLRWGLYSGDQFYRNFRALYFDRFHQLLLAGVQSRLADSLRSLPPAATPSDEWQRPYETLKANLITTSRPEKSTREFLAPVLMNRWDPASSLDEERRHLARAQFDFYADELRVENPFSFEEDSSVVALGRRFLNSFATGAHLVYQKILTKANQGLPSFNFAERYPESKDVVTDPKIIDGVFTGAGWKVMTDLISHPENYAAGDEWVLGTAADARPVQNVSPQDIRVLYEADYKKQWRDFLARASVRHFAGPQDGSRTLEKLSGNRSPLLALLCEVSQNTAEASPDIAAAFQPVQEVVAAKPAPQSCREQFRQPSNEAYATALMQVKVCLDGYLLMAPQAGTTLDPREARLGECNNLSLQAGNAARQIVKTNDPVGKVDTTVIALLLAPTAPAPKQAVAGGPTGVALFCVALRALDGKFPFDPNSRSKASVSDLNGFFQPGSGALSKFLDANKTVFELQGSQYVQKSGKISFTYLVNRATTIQRALYPGNTSQPQYQFTLKGRVPDGKTSETVSIDGQEWKLTGTTPATQTFTWSAGPTGASLILSGETTGQYPGPWGAFELFNEYTWTSAGTGFHLAWPVHGIGGQIVQYNGKDEVVEFDFDSAGVPLFQRGYLSSLRCPPNAK